jgi:hypothetical protein
LYVKQRLFLSIQSAHREFARSTLGGGFLCARVEVDTRCCCFRLNTRTKLGVNDEQRTAIAVPSARGERLSTTHSEAES